MKLELTKGEIKEVARKNSVLYPRLGSEKNIYTFSEEELVGFVAEILALLAQKGNQLHG